MCSAAITDPFQRVDALMQNLAAHLQSWGQRNVGNVKLLIVVAHVVIHKLEVVEERRLLTRGELWLKRMLKLKLLGLSSFERMIARKRSRVRWLRDGDANSKLFIQ